jgi:hypothetical protein
MREDGERSKVLPGLFRYRHFLEKSTIINCECCHGQGLVVVVLANRRVHVPRGQWLHQGGVDPLQCGQPPRGRGAKAAAAAACRGGGGANMLSAGGGGVSPDARAMVAIMTCSDTVASPWPSRKKSPGDTNPNEDNGTASSSSGGSTGMAGSDFSSSRNVCRPWAKSLVLHHVVLLVGSRDGAFLSVGDAASQ